MLDTTRYLQPGSMFRRVTFFLYVHKVKDSVTFPGEGHGSRGSLWPSEATAALFNDSTNSLLLGRDPLFFLSNSTRKAKVEI